MRPIFFSGADLGIRIDNDLSTGYFLRKDRVNFTAGGGGLA